MISHHWSQHWHRISTSHRLLIIGMSGIATFFLLPTGLSIPVCAAISWVVSGCIYLFLTYMMMYFSREENILTLSKKEDAGAAIILLITVLAATASLVAIVIILSSVRLLSATDAFWQIAIVLSTYTVSWLVVHTAFALHYAHAYYIEFEITKSAPLLFAAKLKPLYIDFLYFSMVIGMTCQTADVNIANSRMRFWVMIQGMTAFIFNASLLALAINLISGVVALH